MIGSCCIFHHAPQELELDAQHIHNLIYMGWHPVITYLLKYEFIAGMLGLLVSYHQPQHWHFGRGDIIIVFIA